MKKVVCIGGGTGQSSVLKGLRQIDGIEISSIVGVTDNGGYSGIIRRALNIPQPGDSRNCINALSNHDSINSQLMSFRFQEGDLAGISLGNLIIAAFTQLTGDFSKAISMSCEFSETVGHVYPVTDISTDICAELQNGDIVKGEWEIIERSPRSPIKRLFLEKLAPATQQVLQTLREADFIILCPGSLATAIIATLLSEGVAEAIKEGNSKLVYISNIMTQPGQTDRYTLKDHLNLLKDYLPCDLDYLIINTSKPLQELLKIYEEADSEVVIDDLSLEDYQGEKIFADLLLEHDYELLSKSERPKAEGQKVSKHLIRHDPEKIANLFKDQILNK